MRVMLAILSQRQGEMRHIMAVMSRAQWLTVMSQQALTFIKVCTNYQECYECIQSAELMNR
jgi:hypothetical protein